MIESTDWLGLAAGALTTVAFVPQVVKTWRTRSTEDISLGMFFLFSTGVAPWLAYGIAIGSGPIVITNSITLALSLTILYLKIRSR